MLTIKFTADANKSRIAKVRSGIESAKPQIVADCGSRLVGLAKLYFNTLYSGGTAVDGRKWQPLKESTILKRRSMARRGKLAASALAMGVVTGEMRRSLTSQVSGNRVRVLYTSKTQNFFTHSRPLLPDRLPPSWLQALEEIAQGRLDLIQDTNRSFYGRPKRSANRRDSSYAMGGRITSGKMH